MESSSLFSIDLPYLRCVDILALMNEPKHILKFCSDFLILIPQIRKRGRDYAFIKRGLMLVLCRLQIFQDNVL